MAYICYGGTGVVVVDETRFGDDESRLMVDICGSEDSGAGNVTRNQVEDSSKVQAPETQTMLAFGRHLSCIDVTPVERLTDGNGVDATVGGAPLRGFTVRGMDRNVCMHGVLCFHRTPIALFCL